VLVLIAVGLIVGGLTTLGSKSDGEKTTAKILSCRERLAKYGGTQCQGIWTVGKLDIHQGLVEGVNSGDIGKEVEVRAKGDRASTERSSIGTSIALFGLGAFLGVCAVGMALGLRRRPRAADRSQAPSP